MTLRGRIDSGRLLLESGEQLPDGTVVDVTVRPVKRKAAASAVKKKVHGSTPFGSTLDLAPLAVRTGQRDLAREHDHYAYGVPKKKSTSGNTSSMKPARPSVKSRRRSKT